ncbi:hypothetical protein E2C01_048212 [Portunus trituberculatus]|uniref:Uncharacterized protein n=1 Tax=Portunus trituberculatus TaxID=210409 RepID=A0A5B7G5T5_PORTR|nr:hypothetical protein [Portunus trituberculatus]
MGGDLCLADTGRPPAPVAATVAGASRSLTGIAVSPRRSMVSIVCRETICRPDKSAHHPGRAAQRWLWRVCSFHHGVVQSVPESVSGFCLTASPPGRG